jgi:hypothetical protein
MVLFFGRQMSKYKSYSSSAEGWQSKSWTIGAYGFQRSMSVSNYSALGVPRCSYLWQP